MHQPGRTMTLNANGYSRELCSHFPSSSDMILQDCASKCSTINRLPHKFPLPLSCVFASSLATIYLRVDMLLEAGEEVKHVDQRTPLEFSELL